MDSLDQFELVKTFQTYLSAGISPVVTFLLSYDNINSYATRLGINSFQFAMGYVIACFCVVWLKTTAAVTLLRAFAFQSTKNLVPIIRKTFVAHQTTPYQFVCNGSWLGKQDNGEKGYNYESLQDCQKSLLHRGRVVISSWPLAPPIFGIAYATGLTAALAPLATTYFSG